MKRVLLFTAMSLVILYAADYLSLRYRIPNREPLSTVKIQRYYAVTQKDRKVEYYFLDPENQQCVHSLFPHLGSNPCWYVSRHTKKEIDM
jgi:hypothetical protein